MLPATVHHIDGTLVVDVLSLPSRGQQMVQLTLRGTFAEPASAVGRNYTRTLILRAPESARWLFSVQHDQLFIGSPFELSIDNSINMAAAAPVYHQPVPAALNFSF